MRLRVGLFLRESQADLADSTVQIASLVCNLRPRQVQVGGPVRYAGKLTHGLGVDIVQQPRGLIQLAQNDGGGALTVGTVDGVIGITNDAVLSASGPDVIRADNGNLTINQNVSSTGFHNLELTADGTDSILTNNAVVTTSGQLNLTADRMALNPGSALVGISGPNIIERAYTLNKQGQVVRSDVKMQSEPKPEAKADKADTKDTKPAGADAKKATPDDTTSNN